MTHACLLAYCAAATEHCEKCKTITKSCHSKGAITRLLLTVVIVTCVSGEKGQNRSVAGSQNLHLHSLMLVLHSQTAIPPGRNGRVGAKQQSGRETSLTLDCGSDHLLRWLVSSTCAANVM